MKKEHPEKTVERFMSEEVYQTKRIVIIAEREEGQVHTYTNHLTTSDIFELLKTADIHIKHEYLGQ